jgi:hypothetical protein
MQRESQEGITLEQKLRYLREVENIYRLGKKTKAPHGKSWAQVADARLRHVLGLPIKEEPSEPLRLRPGSLHHQHSPRSARIIERTLKNGHVHPLVLNSYRENVQSIGRFKSRPKVEALRPDDMPVQHFVQHSDTDLHYPHGHMQGFGFVPRQHEVNSHVQLQSGGGSIEDTVPTRPGPAAGSHYH